MFHPVRGFLKMMRLQQTDKSHGWVFLTEFYKNIWDVQLKGKFNSFTAVTYIDIFVK